MVKSGLQWLGLTDAPGLFLYNELGVTIGMATCCCRSWCCRCSPR